MVNSPPQIPDCDSHSPALLDLFISSDATICCLITFRPLENYVHVVASVSIEFPINSKRDTRFHCIVYGYSCADWDYLRDNLREVSWEDIFKVSNSATEFCKWF